NRAAPSRMYRNLVTVFFLCGLWHGASWNFVIWGLWHGAFLVVERVAGSRIAAIGAHKTRTGGPDPRATEPCGAEPPVRTTHLRSIPIAMRVARHAYTLGVVMIGWVFFRADTLSGSLAFLQAM